MLPISDHSCLSCGTTSDMEHTPQAATKELNDSALQFEKLLWSEMLSHSGLEKAFTMSGGESASAFSRYVVEAIAEDLAAQHPLGLSDAYHDVSFYPSRYEGSD